jgi:hypothetical protein
MCQVAVTADSSAISIGLALTFKELAINSLISFELIMKDEEVPLHNKRILKNLFIDQINFSPNVHPIINFGLYCNTSAKWTDWIVSLSARFAMVRDNFRMQ